MLKLRLAVGLACIATLAGCGTTYSYKEFAPASDQPRSAFIDIKQRAVLSGMGPAPSGQDGSTKERLVMCAEPSPDALSSLASEFSADAKYKDSLQATLSLAQQESASFVGLRTQTIQLLRDGMYRLCEGYLAGALSPADYAWLSRRYQKYMVALLTIEQLTRVAQIPTLASAAQGLASASRSATAIQADITELDKTLDQLQAEQTRLATEKAQVDKMSDGDAQKAGKLEDVKRKLEANQAASKRASEVRGALLEGLSSAKGALVSGASTVQVFGDTQDKRTIAVTDAIASSIGNIAQTVLDQDDLPTLCFQILDGSRVAAGVDSSLKTSCATAIDSRAAVDQAILKALKTLDLAKLINAADPKVGKSAIDAVKHQLDELNANHAVGVLPRSEPGPVDPKTGKPIF